MSGSGLETGGAFVVVQARMASTRLPGKVMLDLDGKSVLMRVLERCSAIPGIEGVCCATTPTPDCDVVVEEALRAGAHVFRGSESDVLSRYYHAAVELGARWIMRVTSDCPLIDPELCGRVLRLAIDQRADYACNNMPPTFPHGLDCEALTFEWLKRAHEEATRPGDREHVTRYVRTHESARRVTVTGPGGSAAHFRWTLDTEADLRLLRALHPHLPPGPEGWAWSAPLGVMQAHPELQAINASQDRLRASKDRHDAETASDSNH